MLSLKNKTLAICENYKGFVGVSSERGTRTLDLSIMSAAL